MEDPCIISASRRTDIPACYPDWFINQLIKGYVEVSNPYSHTASTISLKPENVHSIVLWSKNFVPLLPKLKDISDYEFFFMFTLNDCSQLEPGIPSLQQRFTQLDTIISAYGPKRLFVRFDPIIFWKQDGRIRNNLGSYEKILQKLNSSGINSLKTSFMDVSYNKLKTRGIDFLTPPLEKKRNIAKRMATLAGNYGIRLQFCCNDAVLSGGDIPNAEKSSCINGRRISEITGKKVSLRKDPSQRKECGCTVSRDIGSYTQVCENGCLYCYANPKGLLKSDT